GGPGVSSYQAVIANNLSFGYGTDTIYQSIHDYNANYTYYYATPANYTATDDFTGRYPLEAGVGIPYDAAAPQDIVIKTYCTDGCCPNGYTQYPAQLYTFRSGLVYFNFTGWDPHYSPINVQIYKVPAGDTRAPGLYSPMPDDWQQVLTLNYNSLIGCSGGTCFRYSNILASDGHSINGSMFGYYFATPGDYKTRYYTAAGTCSKGYWYGMPYCSCSPYHAVLYYNDIHILGNVSVQSTPAHSNQPLADFELNIVPQTPLLEWPRGTWHYTGDLEANFTLPSVYNDTYNLLDNAGFGEARNVTLTVSAANPHLHCWLTYPINGTDNVSDYINGPASIVVPSLPSLSSQAVKVLCYPDYYMTSYSNQIQVSCVDDLGRPCEYNTVVVGNDASGKELFSPSQIYVQPGSGNDLLAAAGPGIVVANQLNRSVDINNSATGSLALRLGLAYRSKISNTSNATYTASGMPPAGQNGSLTVVSASEAYSSPIWSVTAYVNQPVFRWDSANTYSDTQLAGTPNRTLQWSIGIANLGNVSANSLNLTIVGFNSSIGGYYLSQRPADWDCALPQLAPFALAPGQAAYFSFNCTISYAKIHALPGRVEGVSLAIGNLDSSGVYNISASANLTLYNSSLAVQTGTIIDSDYRTGGNAALAPSIPAYNSASLEVAFADSGVIHTLPGANLSIS
ncbi:MAG TPA: hypothetical protein PLO51_02825, partial [Candidatus Micrarchaeota archaeon]|nr:hypothetical protein [Candidatus Micrarchaeota archaeon]